jgi:transcriptional regulator with XRE-family HTH domain
MSKEAEILDPTGVMYVQENPYNALSAAPARAINVHNPAFSHTGTGEDTGFSSQEQPEISPSLLRYHFLSMTTGCELSDVDIVVVVEKISECITTDYHITFECKSWPRARSEVQPRDLRWSSDTNSASMQAERLREISGLTIERLAEICDVSRTTYHKWISGSPLHDTHREHLLEVLPLMEEAAQRLGSPNATSTWLLTPVSPGGKKPIDYLAAREYALFRGFLLRVRTGQEMFRPLTPSNHIYKERSPEEVKDALERLRPRAWRDSDMDTSDTDGEEA